MKRLKFFWATLIVALFTITASAEVVNIRVGAVIGLDVNVPAAFTNATPFSESPTPLPRYVSKVTIRAVTAGIGEPRVVPNTSPIWIGPSSVNGEQYYKLLPGEECVIEAQGNDKIDLSKWYLDVQTINDSALLWVQ